MKWLVFKAFAAVAGTFCCSIYYIAPLTVLLLPLFLWLKPAIGYSMLAISVGSLLWPSRDWLAFRKACQIFFPYFNLKCNYNEIIPLVDVKKSYIIAMHPHGIVPLHALIGLSLIDRMDRRLYGSAGMANIIYWMPIVRNIFLWLNCVSANFSVLKSVLLKGQNIALLPDGIAGIFYARPGQHAVVLKKRRGMFRLAIQTGASIVPIYCFGANDILHQATSGNSFIGKLSRKLRISITIFWGQLGLPIPFSVNLSYAAGVPVDAPKVKDMDNIEEAVEKMHAQYVASLRAAFDKYKADAGYPDAELTVV